MKLLLISDAPMNVNSGGFSQTLYNVFSFLPPENFLFITTVRSYKNAVTSEPYTARTLTYNISLIPNQRNRFAKYTDRLINWTNYSLNSYFKQFKKITLAIKKFKADIIIVAPNGPEAIFIFNKLKPQLCNAKVFPYFMDDWLHKSTLKWWGNNVQSVAKKILHENTAWLMISDYLAEIFVNRYQLKPARILAIHNPVDISKLKIPALTKKKEQYTIAYAGSLWHMHFDAFLVIAKAITLLKPEMNIQLIVYTKQEQWEWRKKMIEPLNVIYGGNISYKKIHDKLEQADCLLITSSFSEEWKNHSKASVQTKLTDYLKAGRLIIGCGPSYSVNIKFLKENNCGICIETKNVQEAAGLLQQVFDNIEDYKQYVLNGYTLIKNDFNFEKVHQQLKDFLAV